MPFVPDYTPPTCPECQQGKHTNCDGRAWDDYTDSETECKCIICEFNGDLP